MKTWFITLPLMCAVSVALAQGVEKGAAAEPTPTVAAPDKARAPAKAQAPGKAQNRMARHKGKSMPKGDMRQCLDLKSSKEIIRCSETKPKK